MTHVLGGQYCRVLSGQRRPELSIDQGVAFAAESILSCLPYAADHGITLILENHYKDDFWEYPEFAQQMDVFCQLVDAVQHPNFGVNYDPSNTYLAGEDPIELLKRVSSRVVTMHASDRYLAEGTLEDLRREEAGATGYAKLHRTEARWFRRLDQHRGRSRRHGPTRPQRRLPETEDRAVLAGTPLTYPNHGVGRGCGLPFDLIGSPAGHGKPTAGQGWLERRWGRRFLRRRAADRHCWRR